MQILAVTGSGFITLPFEVERLGLGRRFETISKKALLLAAVLLLFTGCAFTSAGRQPDLPSQVPSRAFLAEVPFFSQKTHQCGPAALAMALQWSGMDVQPDDLESQVYIPGRKGSLQYGLITTVRRHKRLAYPIEGLNCLLQEIAAGHPVIVMQNLGLRWLPRWHYAVVVGYDLPRQQVVLHTGAIAERRVGLPTFMRTWQRADQWGLLVLPNGRMPSCADELAYLKAVLGLEQAGQDKEAVIWLEAAIAQWPQSIGVWMALGNARYANGDLHAAARAFERAIQLDPESAAALNNLAHVSAELGELDRAVAAARQAVRLGGPHSEIYRRTLEEIECLRKSK